MQNDDDKQIPRIDQSVTSYNQSGGITAHTVHMRTPPRDLHTSPGADTFKKQLLTDIHKGEPVTLMAVAMDNEAHSFALQIAEFLTGNGYQIKEVASLMSAPPPQPGITFSSPHQVIVGSNPPS